MGLNVSVIFVATSWKRMKQVTTSWLLFIQLHLGSCCWWRRSSANTVVYILRTFWMQNVDFWSRLPHFSKIVWNKQETFVTIYATTNVRFHNTLKVGWPVVMFPYVVLSAEQQTKCILQKWHDIHDMLFEEAWCWEIFCKISITKRITFCIQNRRPRISFLLLSLGDYQLHL
jgi:hypothetical protein